jgi:hypothetical protein
VTEYPSRTMLYLVGQNDTCNDNLPGCRSDCWQKPPQPGATKCDRSSMDTRCGAMLQGPFRRARGRKYVEYLRAFYGRETHSYGVVSGCGHDAACMFASQAARKALGIPLPPLTVAQIRTREAADVDRPIDRPWGRV